MSSLHTPPCVDTPRRRRYGLLSLVLPAVLFLVGCRQGIPAPTTCYQITAATVHGVDVTMNAAGDLYRAGKLSEQAKEEIVKVHNVYRPSAQAAVAGCKVVQNQGDIDKVVANLKQAADKVLEALVAAGVIR